MYRRLFRDEVPGYEQKTIPIHPYIDKIINAQYHCDYSSLHYQALSQKFYNDSIRTFFSMAGARSNPPLSTASQNAADSVDIVNARFVTAALTSVGQSSTSDQNLIANLRTALFQADFSREDIVETLAQFDPTLSISQYYSLNTNLALVKGKAFPSFATLKTFVDQCSRLSSRKWEMQLSPRLLTALIK